MDYETIKVEIDDDVYEQVQQILAINNLTMEQAVQMFFQWVVQNPDKAKKELIQWKNTESGCGEYTCAYCGKKFQAYGNKHRKYCSHNCYIMDRFGRNPKKILW